MTLADLVGRRVYCYLVGNGDRWGVAWRLDHALAVRGDQRLEVTRGLLLLDATWHLDPDRLRAIAPPGERVIWAVLGGTLAADVAPPAEGDPLHFIPRVGPRVGGVAVMAHSWAWLPPRPDGGMVRVGVCV